LIPAAIDIDQILADLARVGWLDYKIEIACGFSRGYIAQVKRRDDPKMLYPHAARLYNFWSSQMEENLPYIPAVVLRVTT
jgi:hypothetical protein